jgi:hypothetical protein
MHSFGAVVNLVSSIHKLHVGSLCRLTHFHILDETHILGIIHNTVFWENHADKFME